MAEPHVSDLQWSRLWHLTLSGADRRRISEAVQAGHVMDPDEALLAAELARQLRMERHRRPSIWLVRGLLMGGLLFAAMAVWLEEHPS